MAKKHKIDKTEGNKVSSRIRDRRVPTLLGLFFIGLSVILTVSFLSFLLTWRSDSMLADVSIGQLISDTTLKHSNLMGKMGVVLSVMLIPRWVGLSAFFIVPIFFLIGARFFGKRIIPFRKTAIRLLVVMFWLSVALGYVFADKYFLIAGAHGHYISKWIESMFGIFGAGITILFLAIIILAFLFESLFYKMIQNIKKVYQIIQERRSQISKNEDNIVEQISEEDPNIYDQSEIDQNVESDIEEHESYKFVVEQKRDAYEDFDDDRYNLSEQNRQLNENLEAVASSFEPINPGQAINNLLEIELIEEEESVDDFENEFPKNEKINLEQQPLINDDKVSFEIEKNIEEEASYENLFTVAEGKFDPKLDLSNYQYPTLALLPKVESGGNLVNDDELQSNKDKIVETLANYGIKIDTIKATIGPTVTLYEIVPAPGVRISKIKNLENDIALSLAALGIRIIAPMPGKGTIGIEVPNQNPEIVSMRSVLGSKKFQETKFELPLALGKTITNETYIIDLVKTPHLLVAGATGQGKSVGLNAILTSMLYKKHPAELKLVLIDPKKVELTLFNKLEKHFLASIPGEEEAIITDTGKVVNTLNSLCIEMDSRYDLLKMAMVRNIKEYNEKFINRKLNPLKGHRYMPYIVIVIDEYADLIMTAGKEIEMPIARIAQLARAIGIHLIIATQRPTTNIITGLIKANFPARIAFRVTSGIDSKTILDQGGANQLIGRGDMLVSLGSDPVRVQCAFLDTPEVEVITDYISKQQSYTSVYELP